MRTVFCFFLFQYLTVSSVFSQQPVTLDTTIYSQMVFIERGDSSYFMDRYEVTNGEYAQFLNELGNQEEEGAPSSSSSGLPV